MKKQLIIISIVIVIAGLIASCTQINSSSEKTVTTAVCVANGETKYYEIVSNKESTVLYEIQTNRSGNAVIANNGEYITIEKSTVLSTNNKVTSSTTKSKKGKTISSAISTEEDSSLSPSKNEVDNDISFETSKTSTTKESLTTKQNETPSSSQNRTTTNSDDNYSVISTSSVSTDDDGWVDKWY